MFIVTKGSQNVQLSDRESAISLLSALSKYNCSESVGMKTVIGQDVASDLTISFDESDLVPATKEDCSTIALWLLALGCNEVVIRRTEL